MNIPQNKGKFNCPDDWIDKGFTIEQWRFLPIDIQYNYRFYDLGDAVIDYLNEF